MIPSLISRARGHHLLAVTMTCSVLALAACGGSSSHDAPDAGMTDAGSPGSDAGSPGSDAGSPGSDASTDGSVSNGPAKLRFLNADVQDGAVDVYIHGQTAPLFPSVAYGGSSTQSELPGGDYQFDLRPAGTPAATAPSYTSPVITVTSATPLTIIGGGNFASASTSTGAYRLTTAPDAFGTPATGKAHVRVVNIILQPVAVDVQDDGSDDAASLAAFAITDPAGFDVDAGHDLPFGIYTANTAHTRLGSFLVPGASLTEGADIYLVLAGQTSLRPRSANSFVVIAAPALGDLAPVTVRPIPALYVLAASPDATALDGYIGTKQLFSNLAFGSIGSGVVPPTTAGDTLDLRLAGAAPTSTPLASLATDALLEVGQQYFLVLGGLVNATTSTDKLALRTYRNDFTDDNGFRLRAIHAATGVDAVDIGHFSLGTPATFVPITEFTGLAPGTATVPSGTSMTTNGAQFSLNPGVRLTADPSVVIQFSNQGALSSSDEEFGVLAGAWLPTATQVPPRYILVKTSSTGPWTTDIHTPQAVALAVTPSTANVAVAGTVQFGATATLGNGAQIDARTASTWTSQSTAIATVSNVSTARGLATGKANGTTTVTATLGSVSGTATITVGAPGLAVSATQPADGASGVSTTASVSVTFSQAIDPTTLVVPTVSGACSNASALQLSADHFTTCVGFTSAAPTMDGTNTVATATPAQALTAQTTYELRVKGTVKSSAGVALGTDFTQTTGFTVSRALCPGALVISQVYGGGGISGASLFTNDYIELHNSGSTAVDLTGLSVQSAPAASAGTWTVQPLPPGATIEPGGYFLIQEIAGTATVGPLPAPDFVPAAPSPVLNVSGTAGKIAVMPSTTAIVGACTTSALDVFGYGTVPAPSCFEGTALTGLANTTAAVRNDEGCTDTNVNSSDFAISAAPGPRNSASRAHLCACAIP
jgi:hypothetical protein